jgi:hypothetical protein
MAASSAVGRAAWKVSLSVVVMNARTVEMSVVVKETSKDERSVEGMAE